MTIKQVRTCPTSYQHIGKGRIIFLIFSVCSLWNPPSVFVLFFFVSYSKYIVYKKNIFICASCLSDRTRLNVTWMDRVFPTSRGHVGIEICSLGSTRAGLLASLWLYLALSVPTERISSPFTCQGQIWITCLFWSQFSSQCLCFFLGRNCLVNACVVCAVSRGLLPHAWHGWSFMLSR